MAEKKRTAAQFFDDAETNGLKSLAKANFNSDKVSKHLERNTEIIHTFLWRRHQRRNASASPCDIKTAKHLMEGVVCGCCAGKKDPSMSTTLQR